MSSKPANPTRRQFLGAAAAVPIASSEAFGKPEMLVRRAKVPVAIASGNGRKAVQVAFEEMVKGTRPVDAAVAGVNLVELDPADMTVGYGGLPNEQGIVELDSCVMDGPTHLAGAVASLRNIKMPSRVALTVMRRTDHVLLVGRGALEFARMHGFKEENLLTEAARRRWLRWKEGISDRDDYVRPEENKLPAGGGRREDREEEEREHGTIHLSALDAKGRFGACTTTSGLAFKIPGRVGDSPLIGCGLYLDNDVGSAGSTGRGEAAILSNGSSSVVEQMRQGKHPKDACLEVLRRIAHYTRIPRLLRENGRPAFNINFYAVNAKGEIGGASFRGGRFAACNEDGVSRPELAALYER